MDLLQGLHQSCRRSWRQRGTTLVVAGLLALGIGTCGATFAVVHALLWEEREVRAPQRLEVLRRFDPRKDVPFAPISFPDYLDWRRDNETLEDLACFGPVKGYGVIQLDEPVPVDRDEVSVSFFDVLGVKAALGRTFLPEDEISTAQRVVVISHGLWQRLFAGDRGVIGREIRIEGLLTSSMRFDGTDTFTIIGVMPRGFDFPDGIELWSAMQSDRYPNDKRGIPYLFMVGRLKPGIERIEAKAELDALVAATDEAYFADRGRQDTIVLTPFLDYHLGAGTRPALMALLGAVALVLLVAWVNAGNLLVVRVSEEERERTIRRALGASRLDIVVRTLSTAGVTISLAFPAAIAIAIGGLAALHRFGPSDIPGLDDTRVGIVALAFMATLTLASLALTGAFGVARAHRDGKSRPAGGGVLLTSEVAIAVIVCAVCGLTLRSSARLIRADPGYDVEKLLMFRLVPTDEHYPELADKKAFYRLVLERIRGVPGVASASGVTYHPFALGSGGVDVGFVVEGQGFRWQTVEHEGRTYRFPGNAAYMENPKANRQVTTPGYFETMGIDFVEGRDFRASDDDDSPHVLIISESLGKSLWPGESPLGKGLYVPGSRYDDDLVTQPSRVIGVVEDAHYREIDDIRYDIYHAHAQTPGPLRSFVVRTRADPWSVFPEIRREIRRIAPQAPMARIVTLDDVIDDERAPWRFNAMLFTVFAVIAGLMTALGIFAVVAQSIVERRREIGVRMAIGARPEDVVRLSIDRSMKLVVFGIAAGTMAALFLSRFVASLLYGIEPTDPVTYATNALLWAIVALLASYVPARRAAHVDPTVTLRHD